MTIEFKNVGVRRDKVLNENPVENNTTTLPIGIKTPIEFGTKDNEFLKMNYTLLDQIKDNLRNLILTNHGERLILYNYGANLQPLLFEYTNKENFDDEATLSIKTAVSKYLPYIQLLRYRSSVKLEDGMSKVKLNITYSIPILNVPNEEIEVILTTK